MDFDPNNRTPPIIEWATYVPRRHPQFKTHKNRGHALNAFQYRSSAILYRWVEPGEWQEVYRIEDFKVTKDMACERCGGPLWRPNPYSNGVLRAAFDRVWARDDHGRIADPPRLLVVCRDCRH